MKDERLYLVHITECIERVRRYTIGGRGAFFADEMVRDATIRNLQIMAESAHRLSDATRSRHPEVDWTRIRGFRNIVVHKYMGVDLEIVWDVVEKDLDQLDAVMGQELPDLDALQGR
jgi:uncharacterized protein with HEPN domain